MHGTFYCDFPGFPGFPVLVGTLNWRLLATMDYTELNQRLLFDI